MTRLQRDGRGPGDVGTGNRTVRRRRRRHQSERAGQPQHPRVGVRRPCAELGLGHRLVLSRDLRADVQRSAGVENPEGPSVRPERQSESPAPRRELGLGVGGEAPLLVPPKAESARLQLAVLVLLGPPRLGVEEEQSEVAVAPVDLEQGLRFAPEREQGRVRFGRFITATGLVLRYGSAGRPPDRVPTLAVRHVHDVHTVSCHAHPYRASRDLPDHSGRHGSDRYRQRTAREPVSWAGAVRQPLLMVRGSTGGASSPGLLTGEPLLA